MTIQIMPLRTAVLMPEISKIPGQNLTGEIESPLDINVELRPVQARINTVSQAQQLATYHAALELVAQIDDDLTRQTRHYRNRRGMLLTCLDEVVLAVLAGELLAEAETV